MWTKPYGLTGKDVSVISCGGMRFTNPADIDGSAELVLHAYERGINYFDTAPGYCDDKSEEIFGKAFKQMQPGSFYVSTKCGQPGGDDVRRSIEKSLDKLGVEKITFFHIWCVTSLENWATRISGGAVAAAIKAKEEGLIEHIAASSHLPGNEVQVILDQAPLEGLTLGYCAINFPYRQAAIDLAAERNVGVVTMNPLGGGLIPSNAERFDFIRESSDKSVVEAALRFNVSQPAVTSALVGFSEKSHIDQAVEAVENFQPYSAEHMESTQRNILEKFNGLCTGCQYCLPCPAEINIPKMMDAYNHRILLGDDPKNIINRLKWHWALEPKAAAVCTECGLCEKRCTQHLPIKERMKCIADLAKNDENG